MSFQGIRKIREARRESPLLLESTELTNNWAVKPIQFAFDLKSTHLSSDIRATRDSDAKAESTTTRQTRKSSFGMTSSSREKDKKIMVGNFLYFFSHSAT
jgi:hypothetical protein